MPRALHCRHASNYTTWRNVSVDILKICENEGYAARMRGTKKTENPHRVDPSPTFVSLLKPQDRAAMAEAWDAGWARAHNASSGAKA